MYDPTFVTRPTKTSIVKRDAHPTDDADVLPPAEASAPAPVYCSFCLSREQAAAYVCPRCRRPYCSLPCYRCAAHELCSEVFYKKCVDDELRRQPQRADDIDDQPQVEEEHVDSEDDTTAADPYLELVNALTTERVMTKQSTDDTDADDSEFDRQLTAAGVGTDVHSLLHSLTVEERANFEQLCHDLNVNDELSRSVFKKK